MSNYAASHADASEFLTALGVLAMAQEEERPIGEVDGLAGDVMHALDSFRESRGVMAA